MDHADAEDVLVSGDKAVARVRITGTHQGEFMGMPATGKHVNVQLIDILRFGADGSPTNTGVSWMPWP